MQCIVSSCREKKPHLDLRDTYHTKSKLKLLLWCLTPVNVLHVCASYVYIKNNFHYLIISNLNMKYAFILDISTQLLAFYIASNQLLPAANFLTTLKNLLI